MEARVGSGDRWYPKASWLLGLRDLVLVTELSTVVTVTVIGQNSSWKLKDFRGNYGGQQPIGSSQDLNWYSQWYSCDSSDGAGDWVAGWQELATKGSAQPGNGGEVFDNDSN